MQNCGTLQVCLTHANDPTDGCFSGRPTMTRIDNSCGTMKIALSLIVSLLASPAMHASEPIPVVSQAQKAVERGLEFLQQDAVQWRNDKKCATCHHGTMTVWALLEAKSQGYTVPAKTVAETVQWTKERLKDIDKPRDTRMGWNMVKTPAVYLAFMAQAVPKQDAISAAELKSIAGHLVRHQEDDGSWAWSLAPAKNRPPPVFESDEVVTLMAHSILRPHVPGNAQEKSPARASRDKATAWLTKCKPSGTTQSLAIRLFASLRESDLPKEIEAGIERLLRCRNKDGGWGQDKDLPSDAFATGQALYFLSLAGVKNDRTEIQQAVKFLVATQKENGSWPMKSRGHPGVKPMTNPVPITYFGSAWATLGLARSTPR